MDLNSVQLDLDKEKEGVWVDIDATTRLCIARMYNPKFNKLFEKLAAPYKNAVKRGMLGDDKANELMNKAISKTILIDWEGLTSDGKPLKYSPDTAFDILNDKRYVTFRQMILDVAEDEAVYRAEEIEETGKKLPSITSGNDNGENKNRS